MVISNILHSETEITKLMGNRFEFTAVCKSKMDCLEAINDAMLEVKRIESLLTTFSSTSITNKINDNAGLLPVVVPMEVFNIIERSIKVSKLTQGAFDITYGSIDKRFWNFDMKMSELPTKEDAKKSVHLVNYKNVILDKETQTVFLRKQGMRIGFGGIGKGYAAEMAKAKMIQKGSLSGVVNAAGDLTAWGKQANGQAWTIGIADPNAKNDLFSRFEIHDMAVATSGDYEKFVEINGKRYSHTIDPKSGLPVEGIKSVTIICPNAELADALTTPVMVMGKESGIYLINQINGVEAVLVDFDNRVTTTKNIKIK